MKKKYLLILFAALMLFGTAGAANAYTVSHNVASVGWGEDYQIPQFNLAGKTLTGVDFILTGTVEGSSAFEWFGSTALDASLSLQATITVALPDGNNLVVMPTVVQSVHVADAGFDGGDDFGGDSGDKFLQQSGSDSQSASLAAAFLNQFVGNGNVTLAISAIDSSSPLTTYFDPPDPRPNNPDGMLLETLFLTSAGATLEVIYTYVPPDDPAPVPVPAAAWLLGSGLVGLVGLRRRFAK